MFSVPPSPGASCRECVGLTVGSHFVRPAVPTRTCEDLRLNDSHAEILRALGRQDYVCIGAGMEGTVFAAPDQSTGDIVKIWHRRDRSQLELLKRFYDSFAHRLADLKVPSIFEVQVVSGLSITVERRHVGSPLRGNEDPDATTASARAVEATGFVLEVMSLAASEEMKALPILDETTRLWTSESWVVSLLSAIERRLKCFRSQLIKEVPDLSSVEKRTQAFVQSRADVPLSLIHGDLCPPNILVDDSLTPLAVLDFGFMSTLGDPVFDASITSAIFNMYGPHARSIDDQLVAAFSRRLGYDAEDMLCYRSVYSLLTSNAYDVNGRDGHYEWCVDMLNRPDVREALARFG